MAPSTKMISTAVALTFATTQAFIGAPNEDDGGGEQDRVGEAPAEHQLKQEAQGIHADAGRKDGHDREGDRVQAARLFVEAQFQVFGDTAGAAAVVERHHEDADKDHGGHRAEPVEVRGHDAVLGPGSTHPDHFLSLGSICLAALLGRKIAEDVENQVSGV